MSLIFFVPGYVLLAALFPQDDQIDWIERLTLSLGLSLAVVPLLGLLLNFTPWGIRLGSIAISISIFTLGLGYLAYRRRMCLTPEKRLAARLDLSMRRLQNSALGDKLLTIALTGIVLVAAGAVAYAVLSWQSRERFTQFYLLGPGGLASGFPAGLNVSEPGKVFVGLQNYESTVVAYSVRVDLVGVENAIGKANQTVEANRTTAGWINVTLSDGQNWSSPYAFSIQSPGFWEIQFLLYKNGAVTNQELHFYLRVS